MDREIEKRLKEKYDKMECPLDTEKLTELVFYRVKLEELSNDSILGELDDIVQKLCNQDNVTWINRRDIDIQKFRAIKKLLFERLNGIESGEY